LGLKETYLYWKDLWLERYALPSVDEQVGKEASYTYQNVVLLVKLDAIGDYVLFRQYLPLLVQHYRNQGKEVHLLGNEIWKGICEPLDAYLFDKVHYINRLAFTRDPAYRKEKLQLLQNERYETIVHTSFHRLYWIDKISQVLKPKQSVASKAGPLNLEIEKRKEIMAWHSHIHPSVPEIMHEFERGGELVSNILGIATNLRFQFPKPEVSIPIALPQKFVTIFSGAGAEMRKWPAERYAEIAEWFISIGYEVVLPGAPADEALCDQIVEFISVENRFKVHNVAGKTNLLETSAILGKSALVFGNETGFIHVAIGMDIPTVCLAGVHHIGYFVPYPANQAKQAVILTAANNTPEYQNQNWELLQKRQANYPVLGIGIEDAKEACYSLLSHED